MGKLAICVPTRDHAEVVEQIVCYSIEYLYRNGTDIYYYDSGKGDDTRRIVTALNEKGYDNIYRVAVPGELSFGQKVDMILSGYGLKEDYDYIWPIKDRTICNEEMLRLVLARASAEPAADVMISLTLGDIFEGDHIDIDSPLELYRLFAKQTTSLETAIYNTKTILKDYEYGLCAKAEKHQDDFWHYMFLYNALAGMDHPVISIISKDGACNMVSSEAKGSGWRDRVFEVWVDEWVKLNYELPDLYSPCKLQAIKDTTSIEEILGTREVFERLHADGILTAETFEKYESLWQFVTPVPVEEIRKIAMGE